MDCKEDIVLVILAIEESLQPQRLELAVKRLDLSLKLLSEILIILICIELEKLIDIIDLPDELLPGIIAILEKIETLECLLSFL